MNSITSIASQPANANALSDGQAVKQAKVSPASLQAIPKTYSDLAGSSTSRSDVSTASSLDSNKISQIIRSLVQFLEKLINMISQLSGMSDTSSTSSEPVTSADTNQAPGVSVNPDNSPSTPEVETQTDNSTQTPVTPGLESLPSLSDNPSVTDLKDWVSQTYDLFPQFKQIYEDQLGLSKEEALAFQYAVMSRESGKDGNWQMDLETGQGGPGHAWGPFQAAVTNFKNGGYDSDILNATGLPTPDMSDFKNPEVSTFAGMKRLLEGVVKAQEQFGTNSPAEKYLLGAMAHHNTGHVDAANDQAWLDGYGNETLRLMQGYLAGHMSDDKAFWTGEPI